MELVNSLHELKRRIKILSANQIKAKLARKSTLPKQEFEAIRKELAPDKTWWDNNSAAGYVRDRRVEITACLNLVHELRGDQYRHGVRSGTEWYYERFYKKLVEEMSK